MSTNIKYPNQLDTTIAKHCAGDYPGTIYKTDKSKLLRFDDINDYCDYLETVPEAHQYVSFSTTRYPPWLDAIKALRCGSTERAADAEKVMDKLSEEHLLSVGLPTPQLSITGALTHWQSFEAGLPNCMIARRQSDIRGANAPLTIYYDRFGSSGLDTKQLINRGVACLAFVLAMSNIRPINLYVIAATAHDFGYSGALYGSIIRVETQPLDLARAAYMLTSEDFTRRMTWSSASYLQAQHLGKPDMQYNAHGPFVSTPSSGNSYKQSMRHAFQLEPDDILLLGASSLDTLATSNPVEWVRQMIARHARGEDEKEHTQ